MYSCSTDKYLHLDNFDLIEILHEIESYLFLLRFAFMALGSDSGWIHYDKDSEIGLNQGMILLMMYVDKVEEIIEKATGV